MRYDPYKHVAADEWLALDESERMACVQQYHRRRRISLPNEKAHAIFHVIVENQLAMGDAFPSQAVLLRLMEEGLDRHEAVHAIGTVMAGRMFDALKNPGEAGDLDAQCRKEIEALTAESWRKQT